MKQETRSTRLSQQQSTLEKNWTAQAKGRVCVWSTHVVRWRVPRAASWNRCAPTVSMDGRRDDAPCFLFCCRRRRRRRTSLLTVYLRCRRVVVRRRSSSFDVVRRRCCVVALLPLLTTSHRESDSQCNTTEINGYESILIDLCYSYHMKLWV